MKRFPAGALALVVTLGLGACTSSPEQPAPSAPTTSMTSSSSSTSGSSSTDAPGEAGLPTEAGSLPPTGASGESATGGETGSTGSTSAAVPAVPAVDQSTPEAAMTSWLRSMVAGDAAQVCAVMAAGGKPITSIPGAADACGSTIASRLEQLSALSAAFDGLTITGATVSGDTATFQSVTTEPALAADVVSNFKAVKVDGTWYVTQG